MITNVITSQNEKKKKKTLQVTMKNELICGNEVPFE
jgi:hypothetical protein